MRAGDHFHRFAAWSARHMGTSWAFMLALLVILGWAVTGPLFHFSDTWQLVINTGTTIVTFLMVFLIQNTQNRDARAIHLKLDELIRAIDKARNQLIDLEEMEDNELDRLEQEFRRVRQQRVERPH
jgi:low affinity Fe/Cu permease